jgi:CO/xanthine dehydrogenase FAD-binding subunit
MTMDQGRVARARIALFGAGATPLRAHAAELALEHTNADASAIRKASEAVRAAADPMNDLHASREYRLHLVGILAERALLAAVKRAQA